MTEATTLSPPETLKAPEPLIAVEATRAPDMVPMEAAKVAKIEAQVDGFIAHLMSEDVHSDGFRARLDSAFRLGRQEISQASGLMGGAFMDRNFVGIEKSPAFKAILEMRSAMDELNPGKQGDLFSPQKLLGFIPFGNKLQNYFRKFETAGNHLQKLLTQIYAARDDMARDAKSIEETKARFWVAMVALKGAIMFAEQLDAKIAARIDAIKPADPARAMALEQEVLFYARQNLMDMQTQMAVTVNGYLSMDVLKKTCREMINGCNRIATTGMDALAVAVTVARATGNQIAVMDMLNGASSTIGDLVAQTGKQLGDHVQRTGDFAGNPVMGVQRIQEMFDNSYKAMDAMDSFRSKAIDSMGQTNAMLKIQLAKAEEYVDRNRAALAKGSQASVGDQLLDGPVVL